MRTILRILRARWLFWRIARSDRRLARYRKRGMATSFGAYVEVRHRENLHVALGHLYPLTKLTETR